MGAGGIPPQILAQLMQYIQQAQAQRQQMQPQGLPQGRTMSQFMNRGQPQGGQPQGGIMPQGGMPGMSALGQQAMASMPSLAQAQAANAAYNANRPSGPLGNADPGAYMALRGIAPSQQAATAGATNPLPRMPSMKKGGVVKKTGPHFLHKGETVIPVKAKPKSKASARVHSAAPPKAPGKTKGRPPIMHAKRKK
jgi:hypothetical protein